MPLEQTIVKIGFTITLIHLLQTVTYNVYFVSDCGEPFSPVNGYFSGSSFLEDDVVYYECDEYYELKGDEESICQHNGTWTNLNVSCQPGKIIMSLFVFHVIVLLFIQKQVMCLVETCFLKNKFLFTSPL